jgi:endonuclease-3
MTAVTARPRAKAKRALKPAAKPAKVARPAAPAKPARGGKPPVPMGFLLSRLKRAYPAARCSLEHGSAYELLVATILSAQCTDERVNMVTPEVFRRWPDARSLAAAEPPEIEEVIRSTGFFRAKAKSLSSMSQDIVARHGGEPPRTMEELTALHGVGRKTANVVLGNAFGIQVGVVVDTHVGRLARRMGLTRHTDPVKVEQDLMQVVPKKDWTLFSHLLIHHGRAVCQARKAQCEVCTLAAECPKIGVPR